MGYDKRKASMERYNRSKKRIKQVIGTLQVCFGCYLSNLFILKESIQEPLLNMEIATHSAEVFDNLTSTLETTECTNVTEKDLEYGLLKANEEIYRLRKELSIFTEKPKNKEASSQHFSHYKHHHTIKYFIGISPQGSVMFISKAFTGRSSDKFITENSGFLKNLLPGDLILADRGFLIKDSVNLCMAEVQMPAFLKGKKQLHPKEVEDTRKLANVRIHVERVIGLLRRKYKITSNTLPMFMVRSKYKKIQTIDKILTVSCALINFCPSIVPQ
ncbi:hypothetical protein PPYR_02292 [Photinus pyralis]|uniref:DDE Tnp4 domain-containing protein n=1 Tax=Photinus pyralis TaxID=7054 RepID=A0A5N4B6U7_PHOPY|nr:hypothetical protein PPYR_02292 [Photinus pyralis]